MTRGHLSAPEIQRSRRGCPADKADDWKQESAEEQRTTAKTDPCPWREADFLVRGADPVWMQTASVPQNQVCSL